MTFLTLSFSIFFPFLLLQVVSILVIGSYLTFSISILKSQERARLDLKWHPSGRLKLREKLSTLQKFLEKMKKLKTTSNFVFIGLIQKWTLLEHGRRRYDMR